MKNKEIRARLVLVGIKQWQLAESLGIAEATLSRKLRKELPQDEKEKILRVISEMEVD